MRILTTLLILFIPVSLSAQNTNESENEEKEVIFLKVNNATSGYFNPATGMSSGGSFPSYSFRVGEDGETESVGFNGSNLRPYLSGNPAALAELDRFKRKRGWMVGGVGIMVAGAIYVASVGVTEGTGSFTRDFQTGERIEKQQVTGAGIFGIGIMVGGLVITAVNGIGATDHVIKAVDIYNSGRYTSDSTVSLNISPALSTNLVGAKIYLEF